jgi:CHASE2 domain-containing sensor protein/signal transduction histidine kinase
VNPISAFQNPKSGHALREWLLLSFGLLLCAIGLASFKGLGRLDQSAYDFFLQRQAHPARDDIIIVAIDDYSLKELGKWPWSRSYHAEVIKQLNAAQAKVIGLDILFTEASTHDEQADLALAAAIKQSKNVVLPVYSHHIGEGLSAALPIPQFAAVASNLGHINLELDKDGVARSTFLREGIHGQWWPHFALALHDAGNNQKRDISQDQQALPGSRLPKDVRLSSSGDQGWLRDFHLLIPFYGSSGHFNSVPFVSVLRGEVPADFFKNKYVLVGSTAMGMADSFPTPVTGNQGLISGIEINANILASLLDQRAITPMALWLAVTINVFLVACALCCLFIFSPRRALFSLLSLCVLVFSGTYFALLMGVWFPPMTAILLMLLAYPLWSWRRLEVAIRYLAQEFRILDQEPHLFPEFEGTHPQKKHVLSIHDQLELNIHAMQSAVRRVRDLRQFVSDSLNSLPDPTLIASVEGNVIIANPAALTYFESLGAAQIHDAMLPYLFTSMSHPNTTEIHTENNFSWWHLLDLKQVDRLSKGIEVIDPRGRDLIVKSAPCYSGKKELLAWIVAIIDISEVRAAERRRDESLNFISHDMRAPQNSILALLELQKSPKTALPIPEFMARIEKSSQATLALADNFIQLAKAESNDYRFEHQDFQDLLIDATEEMWASAKKAGIRINTHIPEAAYPVWVDRQLMTRVLTNLLSNAIKYSPTNTCIECRLDYAIIGGEDYVLCEIEDQGYGIAHADQSKLFRRYHRFSKNGQGSREGVGLGMVFVKAVLDKHQAQISFESVVSKGTCFYIKIPALLV